MVAKALPFDERNQRDFDEMTVRIMEGLDLIKKKKSLRATQNTLADLAKCSRRTLSIRRWPIQKLKEIKNERSNGSKARIDKVAASEKSENGNLLLTQVKNYQRQNSKLFDRVQDLEEEKSRSALITSTLENERDELKKTVERLEKHVRRSKLRAV